MIVNENVEMLFVDYTQDYMKIVQERLRAGKRLRGEIIHLVHSIEDAVNILRERDAIELVVFHTKTNKDAIRRNLTRLRQVSLAEIMLIALFEDEDDISEIYGYGMNMLVPPIYRPEMAVAYFESFISRHRLIPSISSMKEMKRIKDDARMQCGNLTIDPTEHTVKRDGKTIDLTLMEFDLLCFMAHNEGILLSYETLSEHVWDARHISIHSIANRIHSLRAKIESDPQNPAYILTKYGIGYKFVSK